MKSGARLIGASKGRPVSGSALVRQVPFALSVAINRTAVSARDQARKHFAEALDNPSRLTLRSPRLSVPARKDSLARVVYVEDFASKGTAPFTYLRPLEFGGARRPKRFEAALQHAGILAPGEYAIPADGGSLDLALISGRGTGGIYNRMLSGLRAQRDAAQNETEASAKRKRRRARRPVTYWRQGDYIWERVDARTARPLLVIVRGAPVYQKTIHFADVVEKAVADEMEYRWREAMAFAARTAR